MSRGYGRRPDRCTCFEHGFCYKSLACRSKEAKQSGSFEQEARRIRQDVMKVEVKSTKELRFKTWRADGSHENGPIPPGRIPPNYIHLLGEPHGYEED